MDHRPVHIGSLNTPYPAVKPQNTPQESSNPHKPNFSDFVFSVHANKQLSNREIHLTKEEQKRINETLDILEKKNAKTTFIMLRDKALIVNVNTKKVITVFDPLKMKDKIVTQIDSAVYLR